jgi:mannosyl-oligosaccharide alpha-1,2-mannosidase
MGKINGPWYLNEQSHLACFVSGNLLLGGRHLNRKDLLVLGQALLEGCRHSYSATPTGVGPESWSWVPASPYRNGTFAPATERQIAEYNEYGFWTANPEYKLRPEYVESLFYAYRVTGERRYRDWAWEAFQAMEKHCKTEYGYAGLKDVMVLPKTKGAGGEKDRSANWVDASESFWAAETLKYLFLIFDDVSVGSLDDWVYSTEGHLFRRPG